MEPETVVIKVKYGDTLRRFITPVINQELDLNMDRLRDKICYFFKFSPETDFTLTYIDEDDDLVGLVDDEDLRDIVRQALNPVRITVKVNAEKLSKSRGQSSGRSSPQILKPDTSEALKSVPAEAVDALMKTKKAFEDPSLGGKEALPNPESEKLQPVREIVERQLDAHEEAYKGNLPQDMREVKKKKSSEDDQKGYIHVRARRGQATDSHSLAERVRREKISARMRALQALVPGCDKITGKALMLDEIINYVQSLQNQVEFLSMKLTSVNPMFYDFGADRLGCFRTST